MGGVNLKLNYTLIDIQYSDNITFVYAMDLHARTHPVFRFLRQ